MITLGVVNVAESATSGPSDNAEYRSPEQDHTQHEWPNHPLFDHRKQHADEEPPSKECEKGQAKSLLQW
jgi:hypothetical protein